MGMMIETRSEHRGFRTCGEGITPELLSDRGELLNSWKHAQASIPLMQRWVRSAKRRDHPGRPTH